MNGRLGAWDLYAGVNQAVYVNNNTDGTMLSVNICNRNWLTSRVSIASTSSATSPTAAEWFEYEFELLGKGVFERSGIFVSPGHYLVVTSSLQNVHAVVWGIELGTQIASPITLTQNTVAPSWSTAAALADLTASGYSEIPLVAS